MVNKRSLSRTVCIAGFWVAATFASPAQTFHTLVSFDATNGANPEYMSLVQGTDGNFYGTTESGGADGWGTVFKITPRGSLTTLYSFCAQTGCTDGHSPLGGLVLATNGDYYGTTSGGGFYGNGTLFKITAAGVLTTLHSFQGTDGAGPSGQLAQAKDGSFYGTTVSSGSVGVGTVFKITTAGAFTTMHVFQGTDGREPFAGVVQGTDGNFYGTTPTGGANGFGTVFKLTPAGTLTILHSFDQSDGIGPYGGLVQATDGNFYGTTYEGGAHSSGTVFKVNSSGALTTLHSFDGTDGGSPYAGMVQASDGNLYGTCVGGGANDFGTLFKMTPAGTLSTLHGFDGTDGAAAADGLMQATNGKFYGTTLGGGTNDTCPVTVFGVNGCGTVFNLSVGLASFVEVNPRSGKVGARVVILGNNLTGSTGLTFNGTAAAFKVLSNTEITTNVPTDATTGTIKVTTPSGTLKSNIVFRVK